MTPEDSDATQANMSTRKKRRYGEPKHDAETVITTLPLSSSDHPYLDGETVMTEVERTRGGLSQQIRLYRTSSNSVVKQSLWRTIGILIERLNFQRNLQRMRMENERKKLNQ